MGLRHLIPLLILVSAASAEARFLDIVTYNGPPPAPLQMVSSSPGPNAQITGTPKNITVTFTQNILSEKSSLRLYDQYNNPVNTVPVVSPSATNILAVEVPGQLMSGTYRVDWSVQCLCSAAITMNNSYYFSIY